MDVDTETLYKCTFTNQEIRSENPRKQAIKSVKNTKCNHQPVFYTGNNIRWQNSRDIEVFSEN